MRTDLATILQQVQDITEMVIAPASQDVDRFARWPEAGIRALQHAQLGGLVVPGSAGGLGQGMLALAHVCECIGRACASTALCFGMHCVGSAVLAAKATPDHIERYLVPISEGRHLTTLALSEPDTGAHFYLPRTQLAMVAPDRFCLRGTKTFVTNGGYADSYVVSTVAAEPDAPIGTFSCVSVPAEVEGLHWGPPWQGMGMRGNSSRTLEFHDVDLPRRELLGQVGDQLWYLFQVVAPYFLVAMSGTYLGIASAAIHAAQQHLTTRRYAQSGTTLAQQPIVQHRLGTLWGKVERGRQLLYAAATQGDRGSPEAGLTIMTAKADIAECVVTVVNDVMTLMGGIAYRDASLLERYLRDARAAHIMAPTTDILWTWIGRLLLDQPLLSE